VVVDRDENNQLRYYVVTPEGIQPISPVVAAILRANDAYGLVEPPVLTPDQIAKAPKADPVPVEDYPSNALQVLDPTTDPVSCGQWVKLDGAPTSSLTLLAGQSLPVAADAKPVTLAGAGPTSAQRALLPKGTGYFVQVTGQQPESATKESVFWISDLGVRYGMEAAQTPGAAGSPAEALGMSAEPLPIPWALLSLFAPGPTLSKDDALVAH
jgi:type VII secretion protein EccB